MLRCLTLLLVLALASTARADNLDFATGRLTGWEGSGFLVTTGTPPHTISSATQDTKDGRALLHRTFVVPRNVGAIRFRAAAVRPVGGKAGGTLDVHLEGANRTFLPKMSQVGTGWEPAETLGGLNKGQMREYWWLVGNHGGKKLRIALEDSDPGKGCYLMCGGFEFVSRDEINSKRFAHDMRTLQKENKLRPVLRYDSARFTALSNADPAFSRYRLSNCETMYKAFFKHFRKAGFDVQEPDEHLMVAIFDKQEGFEAYLGVRPGDGVSGVYSLETNRLVVYDFAQNRAFLAGVKMLDGMAAKGETDLEKQGRQAKVDDIVNEARNDANISTIMHEVAHQLSFNSGLLNRKGDVPFWLAEGLAVYCEATRNGSWSGIGKDSSMRAGVLARHLAQRKPFVPLTRMAKDDAWVRKATREDDVLLGYSQSWGLFRMLMEQRPKQLKWYLRTIYDRKSPDHRLADFGEAFGDVKKLETKYQSFLRELARKE